MSDTSAPSLSLPSVGTQPSAPSAAAIPTAVAAPALPNQTAADNTVATTLRSAFPQDPTGSLSDPVAGGGMASGSKEAPTLRTAETPGAVPAEAATGASSESEPQREREMNLERLEAQIQEAKVRGPQKVAVAANKMPLQTPQTVAQPVVILPLSEKTMTDAKRKNAQFSVKWLWVWCRRQMKKFSEIMIMYREPPAPGVKE